MLVIEFQSIFWQKTSTKFSLTSLLPPTRISVTRFASPGVPLDAPDYVSYKLHCSFVCHFLRQIKSVWTRMKIDMQLTSFPVRLRRKKTPQIRETKSSDATAVTSLIDARVRRASYRYLRRRVRCSGLFLRRTWLTAGGDDIATPHLHVCSAVTAQTEWRRPDWCCRHLRKRRPPTSTVRLHSVAAEASATTRRKPFWWPATWSNQITFICSKLRKQWQLYKFGYTLSRTARLNKWHWQTALDNATTKSVSLHVICYNTRILNIYTN